MPNASFFVYFIFFFIRNVLHDDSRATNVFRVLLRVVTAKLFRGVFYVFNALRAFFTYFSYNA